MDAGKMKDRITIQTKDPSGAWVDLARVWSEIRPLFAKEVIERGDAQQNATHLMVIRVRSDLKSTARVIFRGRIYDVQSILPHFRYRDRLELTCEELHEMLDTVSVSRSEKVKGARNVVMSVPTAARDVLCCIIDVQHSHNQTGNDPVKWDKQAKIDFDLGEDVREGDTITLNEYGDFFIVEAKPTKHFLSVVAFQEKRGAE